jgi:dihydrofolate reductase
VTPANPHLGPGGAAHGTKPRITIIVAIAANRVIGNANALPWRLPEDLKRFRRLTTGHYIVMGRKTFASLGRLLPERTHIVLSRRSDFAARGTLVARSIDAALELCAAQKEVFVIGGEEIYRQALPYAQRLQMTEIHHDFFGDVFFPEYDKAQWHETSRECHHCEIGFDYDFVTYDRH